MALMSEDTKDLPRNQQKLLTDNIAVSVPLWDGCNPDQQQLVIHSPWHRKLYDIGVDLREALRIQDVIPHLLKLGVLTTTEKDIVLLNATPAVAADRVLELLHKSEVWRVHALWRACALTGQAHLIRKAGLDPTQYMTESKDGAPPSSKQASKTDSADYNALLAASERLVLEMKEKQTQLGGPTGIGSTVKGPQFLALMDSLSILEYDSMQRIQSKVTPGEKVAELKDNLLCCKQDKLILFLWILVKVSQDHQLPKTITPQVHSILQKYDQGQIKDLV